VEPHRADALYIRASCQGVNGDYASAIKTNNDVVALDPTYADAYNGLGWNYNQIAKYSEAKAALDTAIKLYGQGGNFNIESEERAYENRAYSFLNMRQYQAAIADYTKAISLGGDRQGLSAKIAEARKMLAEPPMKSAAPANK